MMFGLEEDDQVVPGEGRSQRRSQRRADHLLRFTAPPREASRPGEARRGTREIRRKPRASVGGAFENSGVRLLVTDGGASPLAADADASPEWRNVCAIEAPEAECPICLYSPRAPVAGSCGHVFCAACVVRHLSMVEVSRSKRCPCCNRSLAASELRPVRFFAESELFVLLERPRAARAARPFVEGAARNVALPVASVATQFCDAHSKLTLAGSDGVVDAVFDRLGDELREAAVEAEDDLGRASVAAAVAAMATVREALGPAVETADPLPSPADGKVFFFYGRADGEPTFLHPLALRCLLAAAGGDASRLPRSLSLGRARNVDRFEQCVESRRRLPWLAHVQLGCDVALVDVDVEDLNSGGGGDDDWGARAAVARDADAELSAAYAARDERLRKDRDKRRRAEKKLRAKAKKEARLPDQAALEELRALRSFELNNDDFAPLSAAAASLEDPALARSPEEPSFAALVARGFAAELGCPALGSSPRDAPATSPSCWGRPIASRRRPPPPPADEIPSGDAFAPPPPNRELALAGALETALRDDEHRRSASQAAAPGSSSSSSSSRKKKEKRAVLSLTGGGRRYD
ncbi:hypothetical protein CTAYLR_008082 [Chrysophaeum taylorii]|uniref:RING-type domain-containing protein n=1 Tax=Chrysophaeum taylorii TaxID=2483200 RepID=A0AAD7ULC2_9STRA|nr:hypothetical protein CTAYLR_008082 [Chrysophaeum taylorii]